MEVYEFVHWDFWWNWRRHFLSKPRNNRQPKFHIVLQVQYLQQRLVFYQQVCFEWVRKKKMSNFTSRLFHNVFVYVEESLQLLSEQVFFHYISLDHIDCNPKETIWKEKFLCLIKFINASFGKSKTKFRFLFENGEEIF